MCPAPCHREAQEESHPNRLRDEGGWPEEEEGRDSLKPCGFLEDKVFYICLLRVLQPDSAIRPGESRGEQGKTPDLQLKSPLSRNLGKEIQTRSMQRWEQDDEAPRG